MFQQEAESEGVQPIHNNNMPNSISEEPINRLTSNLGGSAHQSQLFYIPNSSSEEPIHQLPSNLGGSAHQPDQLSEPKSEPEEEEEEEAEGNLGGSVHQSPWFYTPNSSLEEPIHESESESEIAAGGGVQPNVNPGGSAHEQQLTEEVLKSQLTININNLFMVSFLLRFIAGTAEHLKYYRRLHNAAIRGHWGSAKRFIEMDPNALTARITVDSKTVFHVAALCGQWEFILKLLELVSSPESIAAQDKYGCTVLHYVAQGGSFKTVKALVQKNFGLLQIGDSDRDPPLLYSIWSGSNKELVWYLSSMTSVYLSPDSTTWILRTLILSGYHDIALDFVQRYPNLALAKDFHEDSLLYWLATNPSYFFSGSNLGLLEIWIYKFVDHGVEIKYPSTHSDSVTVNMEHPALQPRSLANRVLQWFKRLLWKAIVQLAAPSVNKVRDAKLKHKCAVELVNHVCTQLSNKSFPEIKHFLTNPNSNILDIAIKNGIKEIVRILLQYCPDLINVQVRPYRNILQAAIEYRQENIINVIKEISTITTRKLGSYEIESRGVTLHLAGKLAPAFKLLSVSGAMQRELKWFKEVEEITFTYRREWKDENDETPKDVFRREHSELAEKSEKWIKDTAKHCMLVSTLIATVLFAAAFTVPGGNGNDNGIAIFLHRKAFMIFAISDLVGLFSSLSSLLIFLAILTARYELDDFLESLPRKLIIGLGSLIIAIAAMIIAFGATLTIVLGEKWHWVFVPITLVASVPVAIFVNLQLPLFNQMVHSTYGVNIFRPWP